MARINIEDTIWKDCRFQDLMLKVGSRHAAKGMILELWVLAQEYWFPDRKLIPMQRIQQSGLDIIIDVGLAEIRDGGVFVIGSDKAFNWLFECQEAGKRSAEKRKTTKSSRKVRQPTLKVPQGTHEVSQPLTLSLSPTLSQKQKGEGTPLPPLAEIWNRKRGSLPEIRGCSGKRLSAAEARWEEKPETEYWSEIVDRIQRSEFCTGKNDRGWKADFDFLIRPDTQHKVLEGKYDNRAGPGEYVNPKILELIRQAEEEERQSAAASGS